MSDRFEIMKRMGYAVQQDASDNGAWLELGKALGTDSISVDGSVITRRSCFTQCLENDDYYWRAWYNLGVTMDKGDNVLIRGRNYDRQGCLVRCLELEESKETAEAWNILGAEAFPRNGKVSVGQRSYTPTECFTHAAELDPENADAWLNTALASPAGATIGDQTLTSQQCVVKSLELRHRSARAWYTLAVQLYAERLSEGRTGTVDVAENKVDELTCQKNALHLDPQLGHAWSLLANTLRDAGNKSITIDGVSYDSPRAVRKALECDPRCALAWSNLAPLIGVEGTTTVNEEEVTAQAATERSLQLMPRNPFAWYNLGVLLREPTAAREAVVGARSFTARECFIEALRHNEDYGRPWLALGEQLSGDETATVNGLSYNRYQCIAKGELLGDSTPIPPVEPTAPEIEY